MYAGVSGIDCDGNGIADGCENPGEVPEQCPCPWDLDGRGVGDSDLQALLDAWGTDPGGPPDFDGDGDVNVADLLELLGNWGPCIIECGSPNAGSCFEEHATPFCNDAQCCFTVCSFLPFPCCEVAWDDTCVGLAELFCEEP